MAATGKLLILFGALLILAGASLILASRFPALFAWFGHLPGDISISRPHFRFYFPLATGIFLSALLSLLVWLLAKLWH